jgi:hypothetical protein
MGSGREMGRSGRGIRGNEPAGPEYAGPAAAHLAWRPAVRERPQQDWRIMPPPGEEPAPQACETSYWVNEPAPGERRSSAKPSEHGRHQRLDLDLLDPADDAALTCLIEAP